MVKPRPLCSFRPLSELILIPAALIGLVAWGLFYGIDKYFTYRDYKRAEQIAVQKYGDKRAPLTDEEKQQWFSDMGVEKDRTPTPSQLKGFIEESE